MKTSRQRFINFLCIFFLSFCGLFDTIKTRSPCLDMIRCPLNIKGDLHLSLHDIDRMDSSLSLAKARRLLGGLGSMPPRCIQKCGQCTPCKPVHVPVPPGTPVTAEYYPEAWRCKCGNKLYMP